MNAKVSDFHWPYESWADLSILKSWLDLGVSTVYSDRGLEGGPCGVTPSLSHHVVPWAILL